MKRIVFLTVLGVLTFSKSYAQNVGINGSGATPDPSAMLDVNANNKGVLIPQVSLSSTTDATTITAPATSLLVYNTNASITGTGAGGVGYYYNSGTPGSPVWVKFLTNTGQQVNKVYSNALTQLLGDNSGSYANNCGNTGWTIGNWQDVPGLSITRTVPAGNFINVNFSISGIGNYYCNYTPQEIVFRIVRDNTTQIGKSNAMGQNSTSGLYNYYYFNSNWSSFDFVSDGLSHTWKVQYWMSNTTVSTESVWVEDRNITITEIAK